MLRKATQLALVLLVLAACSSLPKIFEKDPLGASLYSMKTVYEGVVRSAGNAYLAKQINDDQLRSIMVPARQFHTDYTTTVNLYEAQALKDPEARIAELRKSLDALQTRLQDLLPKGGGS